MFHSNRWHAFHWTQIFSRTSHSPKSLTMFPHNVWWVILWHTKLKQGSTVWQSWSNVETDSYNFYVNADGFLLPILKSKWLEGTQTKHSYFKTTWFLDKTCSAVKIYFKHCFRKFPSVFSSHAQLFTCWFALKVILRETKATLIAISFLKYWKSISILLSLEGHLHQ